MSLLSLSVALDSIYNQQTFQTTAVNEQTTQAGLVCSVLPPKSPLLERLRKPAGWQEVYTNRLSLDLLHSPLTRPQNVGRTGFRPGSRSSPVDDRAAEQHIRK